MQETYSTENSPTLTSAKPIRALGPAFFYFLVAGIATVMLGPILPSLIQRWHILDEQAGALFTASFLGQLTGAWFATRNLRGSVLYGAALSAIGCIAMVWASFAAAPLALFCIGIGLGAGLTAGNIITGTAIPASRTRLLAILNVAWGIGAITCPVLVRFTAASGVTRFFLLTAACLAAASLYAISIPRELRTTPPDKAPPYIAKNPLPLSRAIVLTFGTALLLYVGVENALGGWLPSYAVRVSPLLRASSVSICFWIAELTGRLITASIRIREVILYRTCGTLLILAELLLCTVTHLSPTGVLALTILIGLTLAPLYPVIVGAMLARTGNHPRLGPIFASASLGGAIIPWLTGIFSTHFHGLRAGLVVPAVGAALLLLLSSYLTGNSELRDSNSNT